MDRDDWNERYAATTLLFDIDPDPLLRREVGHLRPGRALDLGAGEGRATRWLAQRGWQVTAVDFAQVALTRGHQLASDAGVPAEAIRWVCTDLLDAAPKPGSLELVLMLFVHPEPTARRRLLRATAAALTPQGEVLVVGYHPAHVTETDRKGGPRDIECLFTPGQIVADLPGLVVERAHRLDLDGAVDTIVRARRPA